MPQPKKDEEREERISMEIIVDCYNEEEVAMGWYYYLQDKLDFPFDAKWLKKGRTSGQSIAKAVEVIGMADEEECMGDMRVEVRYAEGDEEDIFSARLSDIEPVDADEDTQEAIDDWNYWLGQGYQF